MYFGNQPLPNPQDEEFGVGFMLNNYTNDLMLEVPQTSFG